MFIYYFFVYKIFFVIVLLFLSKRYFFYNFSIYFYEFLRWGKNYIGKLFNKLFQFRYFIIELIIKEIIYGDYVSKFGLVVFNLYLVFFLGGIQIQ